MFPLATQPAVAARRAPGSLPVIQSRSAPIPARDGSQKSPGETTIAEIIADSVRHTSPRFKRATLDRGAPPTGDRTPERG